MNPIEPTSFSHTYLKTKNLGEGFCACYETGKDLREEPIYVLMSGTWEGKDYYFRISMGAWAVFQIAARIACASQKYSPDYSLPMPEIGSLRKWMDQWLNYFIVCEDWDDLMFSSCLTKTRHELYERV